MKYAAAFALTALSGHRAAISYALSCEAAILRIMTVRPDLSKDVLLSQSYALASAIPDSTSALCVLENWARMVSELETLPFEN